MTLNDRDDATSDRSRGGPGGRFLDLLRSVTLVTVIAGAVGSVGFMLRVGHYNPSRLLLALLTIWVLAPFVALGWSTMVSKRWPAFKSPLPLQCGSES